MISFKILINVYDRDRSHPCLTSFATTLDMRRNDVVYGSRVGNATNPQFLEIDSWVNGLILFYYIFIILHFNDTLVSSLQAVANTEKYLILVYINGNVCILFKE